MQGPFLYAYLIIFPKIHFLKTEVLEKLHRFIFIYLQLLPLTVRFPLHFIFNVCFLLSHRSSPPKPPPNCFIPAPNSKQAIPGNPQITIARETCRLTDCGSSPLPLFLKYNPTTPSYPQLCSRPLVVSNSSRHSLESSGHSGQRSK